MKKSIIILLVSLIALAACKKEKWTERRIDPVDFLSGDKYKNLVIQVVFERGYSLNSQTNTNLITFLNSRLNKPSGIQIVAKEVDPSGKAYISSADLIEIERKYRTEFSKGSTLTAFVFVSGSQYAENSGDHKILGVQYGETGVALFGKTVDDYSGGLNQPSTVTLQTAIAEHEFGHLLGLVNSGTKMREYHEDGTHIHHCNNENCLMYHAVETSDIIRNLLNDRVPELDNNCIKDLQYNGGK
ncbi:MAG: peptidase [Bacteroidota bacterium]|nr:peptidase [Bacteroidota bacterium]